MKIVIVGAGPAGLTVAETVRAHDRTAAITMLSAETSAPYAPPALADHLLFGRDEPLFWKGRDVCDRLRVDFRGGVEARHLDVAHQRLVLARGDTLDYDHLVIASGCRLFAPVEGTELAGIASFESLRAATALKNRVRRGDARRAVVVGAGFIGVEVALLLSELGLRVTLLEAADHVMPRMLDRETAEIVRGAIERRGVDVRMRTLVDAFAGDRVVERVEVAGGASVDADIVVAATGLKPSVGWLVGSGVRIGWGVWVDDHLRTNIPNVYAAGDVAETLDRMTRERFVHAIFPNAVAQGRVVGLNLLGRDTAYEGSESMNSFGHWGLPVVAVGAKSGEDELRYRHGRALRKLFLTGGRIVGFRLTGDVRAAGVYRSLMLRRADVSRFGRRLVEPTFGYGHLVLGQEPGRAA